MCCAFSENTLMIPGLGRRNAVYAGEQWINHGGTMVETLTRNWGWVALRGFAAILFGLLTLLNPGITLATLVLFFGAYALVDGAAMVVSAIANRHGEARWIALLVGGVLGIGAGLVTFFMPGLTAMALLMIIAAWSVVTGIAEIGAAIRLRKEITGEWIFVLAGLFSVGFGLLLFLSPGAGALAVALWIGAYAVTVGLLLVGLGFRLRNWGRIHGARMRPV